MGGELGVPDLVVHAFTDGRDTLADGGAGYPGDGRGLVRRAPGNAPSRQRRRPLLRDGPRQALGARRSWRYDLLVHGRAEHHAADGPEAVRAAYERGETDEFITPTTVGERGARSARRRRRHRVQLPSRPHARDHARAGRAGVRRDRPRRRAAGRALRDDDRVRGGLAVSGRVPAGSGRRSRCAQRARRARARRSCTSPRPRSTPT